MHSRRMRCVRLSVGPPPQGREQRGQIKDAIANRERPARGRREGGITGHWEGDLLPGSPNTHVSTLVECISRFVMLVVSRQNQSHHWHYSSRQRVRYQCRARLRPVRRSFLL